LRNILEFTISQFDILKTKPKTIPTILPIGVKQKEAKKKKKTTEASSFPISTLLQKVNKKSG
jgi:hypothetical protein